MPTSPAMQAETGDWLMGIIGQVSRASRPGSTVASVMADIAAAAVPTPELPGGGGLGGPLTPEQFAFVRRLVIYLIKGRLLILTYNVVLLLVLAVFSACHFAGVARYRRKQDNNNTQAQARKNASSSPPSSSSSSTVEGSPSPPASIQKSSQHGERQPLLGNRQPARPSPWRQPLQLLRGWLMYQPGRIPIIHRDLPANSTTLLVLAYLGLNVFYQCFLAPWDLELLFIAADRAGLIFVANLPLLYLLAAKNQPIQRLTGYSYEGLNILHRRVGELLCLEALVHGGCMIIWILYTAPGWLQERFSNFFQTYLVILGLIALGAYELLFLTSLGSFRQRWYELFLASHVVLQVVALVVLFLHHPNARAYVAIALIIFVLDRLVWRLSFKSATLKADLTVLDDGETVLVSADWDILAPSSPIDEPRSWTQKLRNDNNILKGWQPTEHVFLSIPALGRTHSLQAHPFTIASAAPVPPHHSSTTNSANTTTSGSSDGNEAVATRHAWLSLLVRAHSGFSLALLHHAHLHRSVEIRLDGPYGSQEAVHMLRACGTNVLVAGGSGIAVIFPLAWSLAAAAAPSASSPTNHAGKKRGEKKKIYLVWIVHSAAQRSWIAPERLDELRELGVELVLPDPTVEAGRPDIPRYIDEFVTTGASAALDADELGAGEWGEEEGSDVVGVVVSGPDGLNRSVRNTCSAAVRRGRKVRLSVEKFGW